MAGAEREQHQQHAERKARAEGAAAPGCGGRGLHFHPGRRYSANRPPCAGVFPIPPHVAEAPPLHEGALWVFGYGSLIWRPGFAHDGRHPALLKGYHRRFCLWSHRYRGTPETPGLVLGLDRGGACRGVLFRVPQAEAAGVLRYLDDRELPDGAEVVYRRRVLPVRRLDAPGSPPVPAVTYVANRDCRLYVRDLADAAAALAIARGVGRMGPNRDYLLNTLRHLAEMGVRDQGLARLAALLPGDLDNLSK